MSPTWGGSSTGWRPPTPPPPPSVPTPPPAPKPQTPVAIPAPRAIPGSINVTPGPIPGVITTPILTAPKRKKLSPERETKPYEDKTRREAPKKPPRPSSRYPWEIARDYFLVKAGRTTPPDFKRPNQGGVVKGQVSGESSGIVRMPYEGPKPIYVYGEPENAREKRPLVAALPKPEIAEELTPGKHTLIFRNPSIFKPYDATRFKAQVIGKLESQFPGLTVESVDIDGRVVTVNVGVA